MQYTGQRAGEIILLPDEIPGLIFTERDRQDAYKAIRESKDKQAMDLEVANRLFELSFDGNSYQADVLLSDLVEASYSSINESVESE